MPFDFARHQDDSGLPAAQRERLAADRAEYRWRAAAAQRGWLWVWLRELIGWLLVAVNAIVWPLILWLLLT